MESPLAFWSFDTSNGKELLIEGYVREANDTLLDIEDFENHFTYIVIAGVQFFQLERDEAPRQISAIAKQSYDFVLGFQAGKYGCCLMGKDPRNTAASE